MFKKGIKNVNTSISFLFCIFIPSNILAALLELTSFFPFSSSNAFVACELFWTKSFILHVREPVMLDHKTWSASLKEALSLRQKVAKHFLKFHVSLEQYWFTSKGKNDANTLLWHIVNVTLAGKVPDTSHSSHLFWNLKDPGPS